MKSNLETTPATASGVAKTYRNDMHCWRNFCQDLIYAGAYGGESYLREVLRRKPILTDAERSRSLAAGTALAERLSVDFPDESRLRRAQAACANLDAIVLRYGKHLPKRPLDGQAMLHSERNRRSGITEEQRQANADEIAATL